MVIYLNWLDIIIIIILIYNISKGLGMGFIVSIFNIIGFIISIYITSMCYFSIYSFIMNSPVLYGVFEGLTEIILTILFYSKAKNKSNFIPDLISEGIVKLIVMILSALVIFMIINALVNMLLALLSSLFKVPILKQLDKAGGMIFGLIKGFFIVYFLSTIFTPIAVFLPESFIGKGVHNSLILLYFRDFNFFNLIFDYLPSKTYI